MHDIDRVRLEVGGPSSFETGEFEAGAFEAQEFEAQEFEAQQFEFNETGEVFGEAETMELASELLGASSERELEQFLGDLVGKAGQALGHFVGSPAGQSLVAALKSAARQVLPAAGSSVGRYFGGASGADFGAKAASAAGRAFGLELEGLSGEDREFEVARRFVDFAGEAVRKLADQAGTSDPRGAARAAIIEAAKTHAPGLLQAPLPREAKASAPGQDSSGQNGSSQKGAGQTGLGQKGPGADSGRWVRHGSKIILFGV
jgi:hypothetical protein